MKKRGYLLIEMMISLVILMIGSLVIAHIQSQIMAWHRETEQYMMATTIAQEAMVYIPHTMPKNYPGFTLQITASNPDPGVPYTLYSVTISFCTPRGTTKELTLYKGVIHAQK